MNKPEHLRDIKVCRQKIFPARKVWLKEALLTDKFTANQNFLHT